mmetsp:Transcript_13850/g.29554  ORF Transcript_13850/g.29554 Transcript_13850/m.29554 type:complete len:279 (+) Transcript_13850:689-1525(+)
MSSLMSWRAMKKVYSGGIDTEGYCGQGRWMVSAWMHCRGLAGSDTMEEISCSMASWPTSECKKGAMLLTASCRPSTTTGSCIDKKKSCRFPNRPLMPLQLTPPNRSPNSSEPLLTATLARSLSSLIWFRTLSTVSEESTPRRQAHPCFSRYCARMSPFVCTTSTGQERSGSMGCFLPTRSFPSLRASRSAFSAAAFSATSAIRLMETTPLLFVYRLRVSPTLNCGLLRRADPEIPWKLTNISGEGGAKRSPAITGNAGSELGNLSEVNQIVCDIGGSY